MSDIKHHLFIFTLNAYVHTFFNRALTKHTLVTLLYFSRVCTHTGTQNTTHMHTDFKVLYTCTTSLRFDRWGLINVFFLNKWILFGVATYHKSCTQTLFVKVKIMKFYQEYTEFFFMFFLSSSVKALCILLQRIYSILLVLGKKKL